MLDKDRGAGSSSPATLMRYALSRRNTNGHTPLHCAAAAGNLDAVTALLAAGARVGDLDSAGRTPLQLVVERLAASSIDAHLLVHIVQALAPLQPWGPAYSRTRGRRALWHLLATHPRGYMGPPAAAAAGDVQALRELHAAGIKLMAWQVHGALVLFVL